MPGIHQVFFSIWGDFPSWRTPGLHFSSPAQLLDFSEVVSDCSSMTLTDLTVFLEFLRVCSWNMLHIFMSCSLWFLWSFTFFSWWFTTRTLEQRTSQRVETTEAFYGGCVIAALEHLHERKIIYRDLKPEFLGNKTTEGFLLSLF